MYTKTMTTPNTPDQTRSEPHASSNTNMLNKLRASVLGANDGIVSVAGIVAGVAGATSNLTTILTAGIAGLVAGAISMAAGEYVSVSSQRDSERALLKKEAAELRDYPEQELKELTKLYERKGLTRPTAETVARELSDHDAYAAHVDAELNIDPDDLNNPWHAAIASALSFLVGAVNPLLAVWLAPEPIRLYVIFVSVVIALIITGVLSALVGKSSKRVATLRVVLGGILAMVVTYGIGRLFGHGSF
jgi:VIT1/CCC1 family predicted Fe2+/Mn2+ transporter